MTPASRKRNASERRMEREEGHAGEGGEDGGGPRGLLQLRGLVNPKNNTKGGSSTLANGRCKYGSTFSKEFFYSCNALINFDLEFFL